MDIIIFEDSVKYDRGIKLLLWLPSLMLAALGLLFLLNYHGYYLIGKGPIKGAGEGAAVFLGSAVFLVILFESMFPKSLAVAQDGIILRFRYFTWKIPYQKINSIEFARGIGRGRTFNFNFSFKEAVEIFRSNGSRIRVTPAHPYEFLSQATRALEEWKRYHPSI